MTAFGAVDTRSTAMRAGAADYLTKPLDVDELAARRSSARSRRRRLRAEAGQLRAAARASAGASGNIVGTSPAMQRRVRDVAQVAPTRATVLITGESGTGKELVARADPRSAARARAARSSPSTAPRSRRRCSRASCSATSAARSPAPISATRRAASSWPTAARCSSTRSARSRRACRSSSCASCRSASSSASAARETDHGRRARHRRDQPRPRSRRSRDGRFREDLYYRLNVVRIDAAAAARARASDIPLLAEHFLDRYASENGKPIDGSRRRRARARCSRYDWPGNVRELENAIERAVVLCERRRRSTRDICRRRRAAARRAAGARDPRRDDGRDRALRDPEDARGDRRLDLEGRRDARHQRRARSSTGCTSTARRPARTSTR